MDTTPKNFVRLANGKLRPKNVRRLTDERQLEMAAVSAAFEPWALNQRLISTSERFLGRAVDYANAGQKDFAREWLNFFESSGIVQIVALTDAAAAKKLSVSPSTLHSIMKRVGLYDSSQS
jgi:hypothetical protein